MSNDNTKNYHIFLFIEVFGLEGGIQSYVKDILQAYQNINSEGKYEADVLILRDSPECDNPFNHSTLHFHYLKDTSSWRERFNLAKLLLQFILKKRPQRVFCGHIYLVPLVYLFCKPLGIPYTVLTYGKEVWDKLPLIQHQALIHAKDIWTISRYSRDRMVKANQINPNKVKIVPCVVNGELFTPAPKPIHLIKQYNLDNTQVLMTVARLWSGDIYKGVDVTIRALPQILSKFPNIKYIIIGRGDDQPRLAKLAQDLGVSNQVIFAGFIPTEQLIDHYRVADAYIMPSQEGFGIVYLEAMACGIPVLAGDADGSADPLQDGRLGWRVPHRDPEAVAHACIEILQGLDPRCNSQWLREQTLAFFSKEVLVRKIKELLL